MYGWWQTVAAADVNGDGKTGSDIGNIGENFYLRPDREHPVKLWMNDFDQNGYNGTIHYTDDRRKRYAGIFKTRDNGQFPGLKKQNLKHSEYASKDDTGFI